MDNTGVSATWNNPVAGSYYMKVNTPTGFGYLKSANKSTPWEYVFSFPTLSVASGATTSLVGGTTL